MSSKFLSNSKLIGFYYEKSRFQFDILVKKQVFDNLLKS